MVKGGYSVVSSLGYTSVMALGGPVGSLIGLLLADRLGRRLSIVCSSIAAAILGIAYPYMPDGVALAGTGFLLVTAIYVMLATGFAMHVPELFPTRYRLRGTAICATAGRITTALVQYVVVAIFAWQGLAGVLTTLAGILVFQAAVFLIFGFETKGRSLENVSAIDDAHDESRPALARQPADIGA